MSGWAPPAYDPHMNEPGSRRRTLWRTAFEFMESWPDGAFDVVTLKPMEPTDVSFEPSDKFDSVTTLGLCASGLTFDRRSRP